MLKILVYFPRWCNLTIASPKMKTKQLKVVDEIKNDGVSLHQPISTIVTWHPELKRFPNEPSKKTFWSVTGSTFCLLYSKLLLTSDFLLVRGATPGKHSFLVSGCNGPRCWINLISQCVQASASLLLLGPSSLVFTNSFSSRFPLLSELQGRQSLSQHWERPKNLKCIFCKTDVQDLTLEITTIQLSSVEGSAKRSEWHYVKLSDSSAAESCGNALEWDLVKVSPPRCVLLTVYSSVWPLLRRMMYAQRVWLRGTVHINFLSCERFSLHTWASL